MKVKVTEQGVLLPREWFEGVGEVEVHKENQRVTVVPVTQADPIMGFGDNPVSCNAPDGSTNHDAYLYDFNA